MKRRSQALPPWTLRIADMCAGVAGQLIGEKRNVLEFRNKPSSLKKFLEPSCAYRLKKFERQSIDKLLGKRIWARTHSAGVDMMIIDEPAFKSDNPDLVSLGGGHCSRLIVAYRPGDLADSTAPTGDVGPGKHTSAEFIALFENAGLTLRTIVPVNQFVRMYEFVLIF